MVASEVRQGDDQLASTRDEDRDASYRSLFVHVVVFLLVNIGLALINITTQVEASSGPHPITRGIASGWWFVWPLGIWGSLLAVHAMIVVVGAVRAHHLPNQSRLIPR